MTRLETTRAFDGKAAAYAQFRPDYSPQAIAAILAIAGLGRNSAIADLGAGTGMLTRHFADHIGGVFAIEPNDEMRAAAISALRDFASVRVLEGTAHETGLPDGCVDAVTAGRAIQWFDPEASRAEIQRILRPGGWLIVVRTPLTDAYSTAAIERLHDERISLHERERRHHQPQTDIADYFDGDNCIRLAYPCEAREKWPQFFGRVQSLSSSPRPGDPKHDGFARAAREIFDAGAVDGVLRLGYDTEVLMKQLVPPAATRHSFALRDAEIESDIVTRFEQTVARFPDQLALKAGAKEWTYAQLDSLSDRIAGVVRRESPDRAKPVALLFDHGIGGIASIVGVLKAGRAYSALSPGHPLSGQRQTLDDLHPGLLLFAESQRATVTELARDGLRCAPVAPEAMPESDRGPELRRSADDIAAIPYTSGTTGRPKGIMHSHRQLLHRAWLSALRLEVEPGWRVSQIAEIAFASAAPDVFVALLMGATICPFDARSNSLRQLATWLNRDRVEIVRMPAALFHQFLDALADGERFPHVRCIQPAGKLYWPTVDGYRRHFARECRLVRQFASTETSLLTMMLMDHDTTRMGASVPVGYPVPGKELWLEEKPGERAGIGEIGEIVVKSRYLYAGVWRQPDTLLPPGEARLHRTGDLARWLPDGSLEFVGRIDSRIKVRGFAVDLEQVEAAIGDTGLVVDAAVVANEDASGEKHLAAYVVPAGAQVAPGAIRARLAGVVPDYMIPSHFLLLAALPLTRNGKVNRAALPDVDYTRPELATIYVAPRSPLEARICAIWEEALKIAPIGTDDDFLEIGGDSIAAIRIASRVLDAFRIDLSPPDLLNAPTIARSAQLILQRQSETPSATRAVRVLYLAIVAAARWLRFSLGHMAAPCPHCGSPSVSLGDKFRAIVGRPARCLKCGGVSYIQPNLAKALLALVILIFGVLITYPSPVSNAYVAGVPKPLSIVARAYVWIFVMLVALGAYVLASELGKSQFVSRSHGKCWVCLMVGTAACLGLVAYCIFLFQP